MRASFAVLLALLAGALALPAQALKFEPVAQRLLPPGVESALWVRDCGTFRGDECRDFEEQFSSGDSQRLEQQLRGRRYAEVWLASGGGNLDEGIAIGHLLRRHQATTRVPAGLRCVSACTVAFLGGVFRFVDDTATYEVHAASGFLRLESDAELVVALRTDPERYLPVLWERQLEATRKYASGLFGHFQQAVHPLGRMPAGQDALTARQLAAWARSWGPMAYPRSDQMSADATRIRREGAPAVQDVLMRIERDAMTLATDDLRSRAPTLGSRAAAAIDILEAMYSSRITSTAPLSQQTMRQLGIVTVLFDPGVSR